MSPLSLFHCDVNVAVDAVKLTPVLQLCAIPPRVWLSVSVCVSFSGFVQTLESPGILLFRIPGLESPGKGIGPGKPWKVLEF